MGTDRGGGLGGGRRLSDDVRAWLPIVLSLATLLTTLGIIYGQISGRLDLIEYRLQQIEQRVK
jgi:hypothetical protein